MTNAWFTYEKSFDNSWVPAVYHGEKPNNKSVNGSGPERSQLHQIDASYLGPDGNSPDFGRLKREFPV
jgi:hypothetical protein